MAPGIMGGSEEEAFKQAAEIQKRDVLLGHRAYVRIYTLQKKPDLVRKEYQDLVKAQPNSAASHSLYGAFLGATDQKVKEGFDEIDLAITLDPAYMPAYYRLGYVAANSGAQLARGEEAMKKYLAYKPADHEPTIANAHYFLGMIYEKQGKKGEAKRAYADALRFTPSSKMYAEAFKRVSS
jgi:Tfp pilus assembly protein PilF